MQEKDSPMENQDDVFSNKPSTDNESSKKLIKESKICF